MIDLRSDTVTFPSPAMRRAMSEAELGDDVMGEDPTVNQLEARAADLLGTDAAVLVSSGTLGNLAGILAHVPRGGEIIAPADVHMISGEAAGHAAVGSASVRGLPWRPDGTLDLVALRDAFRDPTDVHEPATALVTIENTHSLSMGQPLGPEYTAAVAAVAASRGVPLFIDGARLFNAAVALGVPARSLVPAGASATFCLSKSLACPVGSVVVGPAAFIERVRRARKMLGGGMRQAGVFAAAGVVALSDGPDGMIDRLADDHANARHLGEAIAMLPGITRIDPGRIRTNFVLFGVEGASWPEDAAGRDRLIRRRAEFLDGLATRGVRMIEYPRGLIRAMPHYGIEPADIDTTIGALRATLAEMRVAPAVPA
jgi:threonine aldolase